MELPVSTQLAQAAAALLLGGALGVVYDVFRALRRWAGLEALWDLLFWLCALPAVFTLGLAGPGGLRLFVLLAALLGAAAYFLILSPVVMSGLMFCLELVGRAVRFCLYPFTLLAIPAKKLWFFSRKGFQKLQKWFTIKLTMRRARRMRRKAGKNRPAQSGEGTHEAQKGKYHY